MRLTRKTESGYLDIIECNITNTSTKLGTLEDIEEELGIDLLTLFKALTDGFYYKEDGKTHKTMAYYMTSTYIVGETQKTKDNLCVVDAYHFKDYGKTWALTKEELEK